MTPYYQDASVTLYCGDCREVLPALDLGSVDLTLTDPPYGTGGWRRTVAGQGGNPSGKLLQEVWDDGAIDWLALLPRCPVMTFWPAARTSLLLDAALASGRPKHRCLYMRKLDPKPMVNGRTCWSVEPIWVLSANGFVLNGGNDVFDAMLDASTPRKGRDADATGHPYQKPLEVIAWLIAKTAARFILDPFAGSGTTLRAAKDALCGCVGVEEDERWCEVAAKRLEQDVFAFPEGP